MCALSFLNWDFSAFSPSGPELTDQLEEVTVRMLLGVRHANVSKLVLCVHVVDGGSTLRERTLDENVRQSHVLDP